MKRYKECTRIVKCYRWLRYKPLAAAVATFSMFCWLVSGAKRQEFFTRLETPGMVWRCYMSLADYEMGNYVTLQEAITELKERHNGSKQVENAD